jgi:hypothetical protein
MLKKLIIGTAVVAGCYCLYRLATGGKDSRDQRLETAVAQLKGIRQLDEDKVRLILAKVHEVLGDSLSRLRETRRLGRCGLLQKQDWDGYFEECLEGYEQQTQVITQPLQQIIQRLGLSHQEFSLLTI